MLEIIRIEFVPTSLSYRFTVSDPTRNANRSLILANDGSFSEFLTNLTAGMNKLGPAMVFINSQQVRWVREYGELILMEGRDETFARRK